MSDCQRRRAFALSALFTVAVCAVVWQVERPRSGDVAGAGGTAKAGRPLVLGAEPASSQHQAGPPARRRKPAAGGQAPPGKIAILRTARRFTAAFVRYEVRELPTGVRRTIRATATPSFATSLLSAPPTLPRGVRTPAPARVRSVAMAEGPRAGRATVSVDLTTDGTGVGVLTELMTRTGQEWRISGLR